MALRDRILKYKQVATATPATSATLDTEKPTKVAKVATVSVATHEKIIVKDETNIPEALGELEKNRVRNVANVPQPCQQCRQMEVLNVLGEDVPGCRYKALGEYADGWRRLSVSLKKCLWN